MIKHIYKYVEEVEAFEAQSLKEVEAFRIKFLGKKGVLTGFLAGFKEVPNEEKKDYGLLKINFIFILLKGIQLRFIQLESKHPKGAPSPF